MNTIRELVNQGIKVLQRMKINYNSTIGPNTKPTKRAARDRRYFK